MLHARRIAKRASHGNLIVNVVQQSRIAVKKISEYVWMRKIWHQIQKTSWHTKHTKLNPTGWAIVSDFLLMSTFRRAISTSQHTQWVVVSDLLSTFRRAISTSQRTQWVVVSDLLSTFRRALSTSQRTGWVVVSDLLSTFRRALSTGQHTGWLVVSDFLVMFRPSIYISIYQWVVSRFIYQHVAISVCEFEFSTNFMPEKFALIPVTILGCT